MTNAPDTSPGWSRRVVMLGAIVVVLLGVCWWTWSDNESSTVLRPAVCLSCGHECEVAVGDAPSLEKWPRECPNCSKASLYLGVRCNHCRKLIPIKGASAGQTGDSNTCPWCKSEHREH